MDQFILATKNLHFMRKKKKLSVGTRSSNSVRAESNVCQIFFFNAIINEWYINLRMGNKKDFRAMWKNR